MNPVPALLKMPFETEVQFRVGSSHTLHHWTRFSARKMPATTNQLSRGAFGLMYHLDGLYLRMELVGNSFFIANYIPCNAEKLNGQ